jgi:hypothetical protein
MRGSFLIVINDFLFIVGSFLIRAAIVSSFWVVDDFINSFFGDHKFVVLSCRVVFDS